MASSIKISDLAAYAGKYNKTLVTRLVNGLQVVQDVTMRPGVKNRELITKLAVDGQMGPYTGVKRNNPDAIKFTPRILEVFVGQYDVNVDPMKFRDTWLSEVMKPGVNPLDIPFEQHIWQGVIDDYGTKINDNTVWSGVRNGAGNTAASIADGYGTIIAREVSDGKLVPVVTGSMATDTVDKFEALYKSLPTKYRKTKMEVYCSFTNFDRYCEDYAAKYGTQPIYNQFGQLSIRHSNGNAILHPVTWMAGSNRIIITPKSNILFGTDMLGDANKILTDPGLYSLDAGIVCAIGFQFEDLEPMAINDQV